MSRADGSGTPTRLGDTPGTAGEAPRIHALRVHATRLALGLGLPPTEAAESEIWGSRRRARALFLVGLAGWDVAALRRASFAVVADAPPHPTDRLARMLLLEAARSAA